MKSFNDFLLTEAGIPGPEEPTYIWNRYNKKMVFQALPMRDMSEQGMSNLVRYLEAAGQRVEHDTDRNCTKVMLTTKAMGESCLCLNFNGTWHFERIIAQNIQE